MSESILDIISSVEETKTIQNCTQEPALIPLATSIRAAMEWLSVRGIDVKSILLDGKSFDNLIVEYENTTDAKIANDCNMIAIKGLEGRTYVVMTE